LNAREAVVVGEQRLFPVVEVTMYRSLFRLVTVVAVASSLVGCAGMIVGSKSWFDKQRPDVEPMASTDLACKGQPIEFSAPKMDDYREVEARGCGKKAQYTYVKVGPAGSWKRSGNVSQR
jgi:hypothetical protein